MNTCKNFAKKYPLVIVILTPVLVFGLLKLVGLFPRGVFSLGLNELFLAVVIFFITFLFMGKEKVRFQLQGFGYAFRFFRAYFIALAVFGLIGLAAVFTSRGIPSNLHISLINAALVGLTVGIVEDFSFRWLVFGGILQKNGNSKKSIIIAAVVSSLLFGAMHIVGSAVAGEISSMDAVLLAVLKTVQTGVFGIVLAFIYLKTRNIYSVVAIHGLNDFLLFAMVACGTEEELKVADYVSGQTSSGVVMYSIFTIVMIPLLIKCLGEIDDNAPIPYEDDFVPRAVKYEKRTKKAKA